jgi:hypothetical protein
MEKTQESKISPGCPFRICKFIKPALHIHRHRGWDAQGRAPHRVRGGRAVAQDGGRDPEQGPGGGDGGRDPAGQLIQRRRRTADRPEAGSNGC